MSENDLVIVGGSYAGLSCARSAAQRGLSTVLLERKNDLGEKIRTTGIFVGEASKELQVPCALKRDIYGVRLYAPKGKFVDLCSPGYKFQAIDTPGLMRWMGREAEAVGVEIRMGCTVKAVDEGKENVHFPGHDVSGKFAVGADGARSKMGELLGLERNQEFLVGAEVEMAGVQGVDLTKLHVWLDQNLAPGYIAWVVPGVGVTQIGLAVRPPHKPDLPRFLEILKRIFDFSKAEVVERRGGLIPCGGARNDWYTERCLLLGDAAGWVSPLTAGGIHPALQMGKLAGEAIADTLAGRLKHPAALLESRRPSYVTKQWMRFAMDHVPMPASLLNLAVSNPIFKKLAQIVFFHHRGLKDPQAWKDLWDGDFRGVIQPLSGESTEKGHLKKNF